MSDRDWGNRRIYSTQGTATNPSTTTLIAEIDSTKLGTNNFSTRSKQRHYMVTWMIGGSTRMTARLEHALSTGTGSTGVRDGDVTNVWVSTAGTVQYQYPVALQGSSNGGDRLRIRVSSGVTGLVDAKIFAEPLT